VNHLLSAIKRLELRSTGKWFLLSAVIGVVAGLGAIGFHVVGQCVQHVALGRIARFHAGEAVAEGAIFVPYEGIFQPALLVAVMALGGLVSGLLVYTFAPEAEGHGTDAAIDAFHNKRGEIRGRIPIVKTLASAITLGTGGSAGREGPIAQIGAGFGSFLAGLLNLPARDRRIMLAAGMGAGVGAIFRAPLAGAVFAGEILYRDADIESDALVPAAMSSAVAYSVFCLWLPQKLRFVPLFGPHMAFDIDSPLELVPYAAMAVVLVLAGVLYIKTFYGMHRLFKRLPILPHFKPMFGATLAGLVGLGMWWLFARNNDALAVLGSGYGLLQKMFGKAPEVAPLLLVAVALVKILTTSLTISSGGSGGVFGPSMVIGGCLGGAVGLLFHGWWPWLVKHPQAFAIVGMAGFFSGCARAPLSTVLMVSEMTGGYGLLLPTLWVSTLTFLLGRRWTLYVKQVPTRLDSPAHRGDFFVDVLEGIRVENVFQRNPQLKLIHEGTTLDEIVHALAESTQRYFPVVDAAGRMVGIFSAEDVRGYLYDDTIWQIANARDVMKSSVVTVSPGDDLNTALGKFTSINVDELPVVDAADRQKLLGILRRKEVIAAYNLRRLEHEKLRRASRGTDGEV
jgi:CIC family chloride channel protein